MTEDQRQAYEADLETVMAYLDQPPEPGSAEDQHFARLLERLERAEAELTASEPDAEPPAMAEEVRQRLAALRALTEPQEKPRFVKGGDEGLGPTLGMDVGR